MKIIVLLVVCTLPCACMAWSVTPLEPQRFSAEKSPARVQVILRDSTRLSASHPVIVGDSLVWVDSARVAVPVSSIRRVEVHERDSAGTALLLILLGGTIAGVLVVVNGLLHVG